MGKIENVLGSKVLIKKLYDIEEKLIYRVTSKNQYSYNFYSIPNIIRNIRKQIFLNTEELTEPQHNYHVNFSKCAIILNVDKKQFIFELKKC